MNSHCVKPKTNFAGHFRHIYSILINKIVGYVDGISNSSSVSVYKILSNYHTSLACTSRLVPVGTCIHCPTKFEARTFLVSQV